MRSCARILEVWRAGHSLTVAKFSPVAPWIPMISMDSASVRAAYSICPHTADRHGLYQGVSRTASVIGKYEQWPVWGVRVREIGNEGKGCKEEQRCGPAHAANGIILDYCRV